MPLNPPQDYRKTAFTHRRGSRINQPAATDVLPGTLYFVVEEFVTERSNGATWDSYSDSPIRGVNTPVLLAPEVSEDYILSNPSSFPSSVVQTTTSTGTQNDFQLLPNCTLLRCNNASLLTLTGMTAGYDGQLITIAAVGSEQVNISNQDLGSVSSNRFQNFCLLVTPLAPINGRTTYRYDGISAKWRLVQHTQGEWIDIPFNAGNFTVLTGGGSWTVVAGNVNTNMFYLMDGKSLNMVAYINQTSIATVVNTLAILIPNSWTTSKIVQSIALGFDNGNSTPLYNRVGVLDTTHVEIGRGDTVAFAASSNNTFIRVNIIFPLS